MKFSANLGFLWAHLPLPEAIRAAHRAGFDAVECHWPYATPAEEVRAALEETGLTMLGLNAPRGNPALGENGLAALPGREEEARASIDQALAYARMIGAKSVHVLAGRATGPEARAAYVAALRYACQQAQDETILIEPLNPYNAPDYFLNSTSLAAEIIAEIGAPNLRLMFDCYHVQILEGDVCRRLERLLPITGHIQFASVPDRGTPDHGELNYRYVFERIAALGWECPLGAEYVPPEGAEPDLNWLGSSRKF